MKIKNIFNKSDCFGICVYSGNKLSFREIDKNELVYQRKIKNVCGINASIVQADPFLFVKGDTLYLFFELEKSLGVGVISMVKTKDLKIWSKPVVVLKEVCHLSFPSVFEDNGVVYMVPETNNIDSVRLYKADNDELTSFSYYRTLASLKRDDSIVYNLCDSHIYKKDNVYYLFSSYWQNWKYKLNLYYSDDLLNGEFKLHPMSPICVDNEYGRCGGSVLSVNGNDYRISQKCVNSYGENLSAIKINEISKETYKETVAEHDIIDRDNPIFKGGSHQLSIVKFNGKYVYTVDFKELRFSWSRNLYFLCKSIMKKLKK